LFLVVHTENLNANNREQILEVIATAKKYIYDNPLIKIDSNGDNNSDDVDVIHVDNYDVQISSSKSNNKLPVGCLRLCNLGNTCYMNALLQCLIHVPKLQSLLLKHRPKSGTLVDFLCRIFQEAWSGNQGNTTNLLLGLKSKISEQNSMYYD